MSIRKSLAFSFLDRYASLAINVASSMFIARLLTPAEIGVFSVTMVLLAFAATVRDLGAGQYLVQEKELSQDRIRAVWAVQLGLGLLLALVMLIASVPVAIFYNEPRMRDIMLIVAVSYAINPFGSLTYAWLSREMRFDALALMRFLGSASGAAVSVALAWADFGPISLALGTLTTTIVNAGISMFYRPATFPWLPGTKELKRVLSFGSQLTATSFIQTMVTSTPELLLGKLQSMTAAGLFSRSNGLVQMFGRLVTDAIYSLSMAWFAKELRENGRFVDPFLKGTAFITALGWSFCAVVILIAQPLTRLLYGLQWDASVDLTRLLAISYAIGVSATLCAPALVASGAVHLILRYTVITGIAHVVGVAIGSYFGLLWMGAGIICATIFSAYCWWRAAHGIVGFDWRELFSIFRRSLLVAAMASVAPLLVLLTYGAYPEEIWPPLILGGGGAGIGFLAGVLWSGHPLASELHGLWEKVVHRMRR